MTIRALTAALSLAALTPLAAQADAPSGDFHQLFAQPAAIVQVPSTRAEHRNYVEFTIDDLVRDARHNAPTVEEVRRALALMPQPRVEA